jgi:hypothetical protein
MFRFLHSRVANFKTGAGEEGRTPDLMLGKHRRRKTLKPA